MLKAYKYRLYPTEEQKIQLAKTFGCVRFVYNYYLEKKMELYFLRHGEAEPGQPQVGL